MTPVDETFAKAKESRQRLVIYQDEFGIHMAVDGFDHGQLYFQLLALAHHLFQLHVQAMTPIVVEQPK